MNDWFDLASGVWLLGVTLAGLLALGCWLSRRPNPADEQPPAFLVGRPAPKRQPLPIPTPVPMAVSAPAYEVAAYAESIDAASNDPQPPEDTPTSTVYAELPSDPYQQWLESMQATWQATPAYLH